MLYNTQRDCRLRIVRDFNNPQTLTILYLNYAKHLELNQSDPL